MYAVDYILHFIIQGQLNLTSKSKFSISDVLSACGFKIALDIKNGKIHNTINILSCEYLLLVLPGME